jgi:hypothetical protein
MRDTSSNDLSTGQFLSFWTVSDVPHPMYFFTYYFVSCICLIFNFLPLYVQLTEVSCFHSISHLMSDILVDGTTNFAHGYPSFAVSVGVLFRGNPAAAAVVLIV